MWKSLFILALISPAIFALKEDGDESEIDTNRKAKLLPIFQVVRFPNDVCAGSSRNGTCFTAEECSAIGGTNEGSCASGFGICCVTYLSCGGSSSVNNTYIVQSSTTSLTSPCTYTICPCSTDICRIRYDFTTNTLASQQTATAADNTAAHLYQNGAVGDCVTDQMSITSPGRMGSPVICGTNSNQHMILDSAGTECQTVTFNIGASTTTTRSWDIYVKQFTCGEEDMAGPPGCLQYYTGTTGLVKTFGYLTSNTASTGGTAATTTHLQNQQYEVCVRRAASYCYICWASWNSITAAASFGLSTATADAAKSAIGTECFRDYVTIPQGTTAAIAAKTTPVAKVSRFCGRMLNPATAIASSATVCSRTYPFRLGVTTDDMEICTSPNTAIVCELDTTPGGILGFALGFTQMSC